MADEFVRQTPLRGFAAWGREKLRPNCSHFVLYLRLCSR